MDTKTLALHLIKEDLKYHQMVAQCSGVEIHIEFFPDLASAVKTLLGQAAEGSDWEDKYVLGIGLASNTDFGDQIQIEKVASDLLKKLIND